jgi:hypothetical protein
MSGGGGGSQNQLNHSNAGILNNNYLNNPNDTSIGSNNKGHTELGKRPTSNSNSNKLAGNNALNNSQLHLLSQ